MSELTIPHLVDTESVRQEAAAQYGGLQDAAALVQAWRSTVDPNVEATALKRVNVEETKKLNDELFEAEGGDDTTVHQKLEDALGPDHRIAEVLDVAVRGHALSVVGLDASGAPVKVVVPYTDRFKSVGLSPAERAARANAQAEHGRAMIGIEARQEIERRVKAATADILQKVTEMFAARNDELTESRDKVLAEAAEDETEGEGADDAATPPADSEASWPRTHDELDKLGKDNNVEFGARDNTETKAKKLEAAGVKPPTSE